MSPAELRHVRATVVDRLFNYEPIDDEIVRRWHGGNIVAIGNCERSDRGAERDARQDAPLACRPWCCCSR